MAECGDDGGAYSDGLRFDMITIDILCGYCISPFQGGKKKRKSAKNGGEPAKKKAKKNK